MNRISTAASLSLSVVAVVLAALAFLDSRSNSAASDSGSTVVGDDSNETIAKLERDLADLTVKYNDLVSKDTEKKASAKKWAAKKASKTGAKSEGIASGGGEKLEETVALLRERVHSRAPRIFINSRSRARNRRPPRSCTARSPLFVTPTRILKIESQRFEPFAECESRTTRNSRRCSRSKSSARRTSVGR